MAKNPSQVTVDISDLPAQVAGLTVKVDLLIKFVAAATILGTGAIGGQFYMAYGHATALGTVKQDISKLQGTMNGVNDNLTEILKELRAKLEQPLQKQGSLENLPLQMGKWTGVKADSTERLADALLKTPMKSPVVVYTDDAAAAAAIKSMIEAQ